MDIGSNSESNVNAVHQLLKELDTLLVTLEQTRLEMPSQLDLEMAEVSLSEERAPNLEDDFLTDWF